MMLEIDLLKHTTKINSKVFFNTFSQRTQIFPRQFMSPVENPLVDPCKGTNLKISEKEEGKQMIRKRYHRK